MKTTRNKLIATLATHCVVNIIADGKELKYRYRRDSRNPNYGVWFCNDENTGMQYSQLLKHLIEKYKVIEITYKRVF